MNRSIDQYTNSKGEIITIIGKLDKKTIVIDMDDVELNLSEARRLLTRIQDMIILVENRHG